MPWVRIFLGLGFGSFLRFCVTGFGFQVSGLWRLIWLRCTLVGTDTEAEKGHLMDTCEPKPYKIVGYDPLIIGKSP